MAMQVVSISRSGTLPHLFSFHCPTMSSGMNFSQVVYRFYGYDPDDRARSLTFH
jgi:hypothetical protein